MEAAQRLSKACDGLTFQHPVAHVYNPLSYAWDGQRQYIERFAYDPLPRPVLFVGMNPGPWGMGQTGVPFGDVDKVQAMGIEEIEVQQPAEPLDKRPVDGLDCHRNEVSGTRLYTGLQAVYGTLQEAYQHLFIVNYCPLLFYDEDARNLTPPRLRKADREAIFEVCQEHLIHLIEHFQPDHLVGIGKFAQRRANAALEAMGRDDEEAGYLLHPSPANPMANKDGGAYW
ncbi:MAG: single-stranded DNA-binding protein, partial [Candidatus Thermoplasmatota archaeon]|nr:single-stranded DNA-binding protein [Candidatus Thermoplasmatota archaeon]